MATSSASRARLFTTALVLAASVCASAREILFLTNGRSIVVDRYWEEGEQILYQKNGSTFGFPRTLLERVDRAGGNHDLFGRNIEPAPVGQVTRNRVAQRLRAELTMADDQRLRR